MPVCNVTFYGKFADFSVFLRKIAEELGGLAARSYLCYALAK